MLWKAKESQNPPGAGRGQEGFSLRASGGNLGLLKFDFQLLASRAVGELVSVLSHLLYSNFNGICRKLI